MFRRCVLAPPVCKVPSELPNSKDCRPLQTWFAVSGLVVQQPVWRTWQTLDWHKGGRRRMRKSSPHNLCPFMANKGLLSVSKARSERKNYRMTINNRKQKAYNKTLRNMERQGQRRERILSGTIRAVKKMRGKQSQNRTTRTKIIKIKEKENDQQYWKKRLGQEEQNCGAATV